MKTTLYIQSLLLITVMASCGNPQPHATVLLVQAEQLMDDHPDSAMVLIDSISNPEKIFNKENYMRYWLARVQARHKNHLPVNEDTLIFAAKDYFTTRNKNPEQAALACFYSGCVSREQGNLKQAMQHYKDAGTFASKTNDIDLKGLIQYNIGDLFAEQGVYNEALYNYQQAERFYTQSPDKAKEKQVNCLSAIGQMFILSGKQDSAFVTFHKGLEIAESIENRELQSLLAQNLSIAYSEIEQYKDAITFLHQSFRLSGNSTDLPRYYLIFSKLYAKTGQKDSLSLYISKLKQTVDESTDLYFKASAYNLLAVQAKNNENYDIAFDYQQKRNEVVEKINEERFHQSVYEVQQKYDYIKQQNRHNHQLLQRQRFSIIILTFFLIASLLSLFLLRQVILQKNKLISLQNTIQTLNKTAKDLQKRKSTPSGHEKQLRETLLWKFNVLHKSTLLKSEFEQIEKMDSKKAIAKFDQIVYGKNNESQWNTLVDTIDELYPDLSHFIRNTYPQFSDTEFKVCMLSYAGLPNKEIALLINQSVHTVSMARTHIRQKMDLQEPGADFCEVLKQSYKVNRTF